jgi:hypothetical protein
MGTHTLLGAGLPVGIFSNQNPNLGKFGRAWNEKGWYFLRPFGTFCGHLVHFVVIWYILWPFGN